MSIDSSKMPKSSKCGSNVSSKVKEILKERKMDWIEVEGQIKYLQGKVLTVIDASYTDPTQRKAIKDIINSDFSRNLNVLYEYSHPNIAFLQEEDMVGVDVEATLNGEANNK
jgi:hypothetical protein